MTAVGTAGEAAGGVLGGAIGGAIGAPILPPLGGLIGRWLGSRLGRAAGRAAAEVLANQMDDANDAADEQSTEDATELCTGCDEIDCFTPPDGADPEEFARQLKEQQDAINQMSPDQLLQNMDRFAQEGRGAGEAMARRLARNAYRGRRVAEEIERLMGEGHSVATAERLAGELVGREMRDLDVLHTPDMGAGGSGTISGLGNRSINRSIGSQWGNGRADQLRKLAEQAQKEGRDSLDVELKICGEEGQSPAGPAGSGQGPGSPGSGSGSSGGLTS